MLLSLLLAIAAPSAWAGPADVGGYFRLAARPDLQGGNGRLGYWNLYGRLLNESSYALVDLRVNVLEAAPGSDDIWTSVHARVEGGSVGGADPGNGSLANLRLSQVYVKAGNVLVPGVTWQVGSLDWYLGDLGLYDFRPANLFAETIGVSGRLDTKRVELVVGLGDAGYALRPGAYNTILSPGGTARLRLGKLEIAGGAQLFREASVAGKRDAPHATPGLDYEDFVRGEVVENWLSEHPGQEDQFPDPVPTSATSYKLIGYVGFGGIGPLVWSGLHVSYRQLHPDRSVTETFGGRTYDLYVTELTDQRRALDIGNELQLRIVPDRLDLAWAVYYGNYTDGDNDIKPSDFDREFGSTVLRGQVYLTDTVHLLLETSAAREHSRNGRTYRNTKGSIFENTGGTADREGLEYGDADTRDTWQGKGGFVLNPTGTGIFSRPSLRALYGVQYSTQNNAFGNSFVETLDQFNDFGAVERHWHHVLSLETEVWF